MNKQVALRALVATFLGCAVAFGVVDPTQAEALENLTVAVAVAASAFGAAELLKSRGERGR